MLFSTYFINERYIVVNLIHVAVDDMFAVKNVITKDFSY